MPLNVSLDAVRDELTAAMPKIGAWAELMEQQAIEHGHPLSESELADAAACGVQHPERIRLWRVEQMPMPADPELVQLARYFLFGEPLARCFRYGILMRPQVFEARKVRVHEFVHVAQYERAGSIRAFLEAYLAERLAQGYSACRFEREAEQVALRVLDPALWREQRLLGIPWKKGGRDFNGCDCIGIVLLWAREVLGLEIEFPPSPHPLESIDALARPFLPHLHPCRERGDVAFFQNQKSGLVTHFSLYLEPRRFLGIRCGGATTLVCDEETLMRRLGKPMIGAISIPEALALGLVQEARK
jgi:hypothetical protein